MRRPNVLLITTDQQRHDALGCAGNPAARTPSLDRLAREGVRATRAYAPSPVCTPSRASLLTGRLPGAHGAWNVGVGLPEDNPSFAAELASAGYATTLVGKAHLQPWGAPAGASLEAQSGMSARCRTWHGPYYGFDRVELCVGHGFWGFSGHYRNRLLDRGVTPAQLEAWSGGLPVEGDGQVAAYDWTLPEEHHSSVWVGERAAAALERHARDGRPFLLFASFPDPHHPFAVPAPWNAPRAGVAPPVFEEGELDDKPEHFRLAREGRLPGSRFLGGFPMAGQHHGQDYRRVTPAWARASIERYQGMVSLVDREVGRLLETLDRLGLADDTLVVFTSDHGELLGHHGLWMKGPFHYEDVLRVPLLARWPAGLPAERLDENLASLTDLAPTILTAAGLPVPPAMDDGRDLLGQWRGERRARDSVAAEFVDDPATLDLATLITADRKLTVYRGGAYAGRGAEVGELYDLAADPGERRNLWNEPAYAGERARLTAELTARVASRASRRMAPRLAGY